MTEIIHKGTEHFGAVMVVNFDKNTGVLPNPQKTEMLWTKTPEVWVCIKNEFEKYIDVLKTKRDGEYRYRKKMLETLDRITEEMKYSARRLLEEKQAAAAAAAAAAASDDDGDGDDMSSSGNMAKRRRLHGTSRNGGGGGNSNGEGPLRGILRLPPKESGDQGGDTYHQTVKVPISLMEVRAKVKENMYRKGKELAQFQADVELVFRNAIQWHSERWIPDTDESSLDPNDCTEDDIKAAGAKAFITNEKHGAYTLAAILKEEKIPTQFLKNTLIQNQEDHKKLKDKDSEFNWGTSLLMPHRQDVAAVRLALKLEAFAIDSIQSIVPEMEEDFRKLKRVRNPRPSPSHPHPTSSTLAFFFF